MAAALTQRGLKQENNPSALPWGRRAIPAGGGRVTWIVFQCETLGAGGVVKNPRKLSICQPGTCICVKFLLKEHRSTVLLPCLEDSLPWEDTNTHKIPPSPTFSCASLSTPNAKHKGMHKETGSYSLLLALVPPRIHLFPASLRHSVAQQNRLKNCQLSSEVKQNHLISEAFPGEHSHRNEVRKNS